MEVFQERSEGFQNLQFPDVDEAKITQESKGKNGNCDTYLEEKKPTRKPILFQIVVITNFFNLWEINFQSAQSQRKELFKKASL